MSIKRRSEAIGFLISFAILQSGIAAEPSLVDVDAKLFGIASKYRDHSQLNVVIANDGTEQAIKSVDDWERRRQHIAAGMQLVMGALPDDSRRVPLDVAVLESTETPKYIRKKITYAADPEVRTPAYLLVPYKSNGKMPAMLCLHSSYKGGNRQCVGLEGNPTRFYAHELAERGFVCLVPDYPGFGDYSDLDMKKQLPKYASGSMKAIWDNIRGLDLLQGMAEVDANRIGAIGHSLGGHNALFTAVFEQRLKVIVTSCGFTAFHHYYEGNLTGWTSERYMPRINDVYEKDPARMPFDFHEVLAAISPRPVFVSAPLHDHNFENVGVKKVVAAATEIFRLHEKPANLHVIYPACKHDFPDDVRKDIYQWLAEQL